MLLGESYMPIWRVCLYSTKQQETKNIRFKRAECPELEKRNLNVHWGVVAMGFVEKKKENRKSWEYYDTKNQRELCQVKRHKGCERYRKWNRPWPHARNEADIRVRIGIQQYEGRR